MLNIYKTNKKMRIKQEFIERVQFDRGLRRNLAKTLKKSEATIYRWLWGNSDNLTKMDALRCISEHLGVSIDELIDK